MTRDELYRTLLNDGISDRAASALADNLDGPVVSLHAAPADAALENGDAAVWFDQTNGASKLMVKAKSANGTVVTGSVTLS
jgi:hypothetical protein